MAQIELFHGSRALVEKPQLAKCRPFNDYGPAFYCTESLELAKEWACNLGEDGIANCYGWSSTGWRCSTSTPRSTASCTGWPCFCATARSRLPRQR